MRLPNHIMLDFLNSTNNTSTQYWVYNVITQNEQTHRLCFENKILLDKIKSNKVLRKRFLHKEKFNLKYQSPVLRTLQRVIYLQKPLNQNTVLNTLLSSINIIFLRKEPIYTKLKYSRTAAYDIVGGGAALFLAGLLGFLTTEKFGFELLDSGDFYYLFMYGVFITFALRPLLVVINPTKSFFNAISLKPLFTHYRLLLSYFINFFK